jgi:hypothetical protein
MTQIATIANVPDPRIEKALTRELREHRDFIYDEYLEMPIVF